MGSNRKRPFGYRMELGETVLHPAEAEAVRWIYDSYLAGASYNALVDKLRERGIPYDGDKPWNKNMAARILGGLPLHRRGWIPVHHPKGAVPNGAGTTAGADNGPAKRAQPRRSFGSCAAAAHRPGWNGRYWAF